MPAVSENRHGGRFNLNGSVECSLSFIYIQEPARPKPSASSRTELLTPKTVKTYTERLGYFLDWCERRSINHLDQLTEGDDLLPYVSFLRQRKTARDTLFDPVTSTTSSKRATHSCVPMPSFFAARSLGSWTTKKRKSSPTRHTNSRLCSKRQTTRRNYG
jgi:hypothetical protein